MSIFNMLKEKNKEYRIETPVANKKKYSVKCLISSLKKLYMNRLIIKKP